MYINTSTSPPIFWWNPSAWVRVSGADAATFLQGQFTNDLRALEQRPAVYGLWLTVKGKVLADSFVLRGTRAEEFWLGSYFSRAEVICERLQSHVIADEVAIEDRTAEWSAVSILDAKWTGVGASPAIEGFIFPGRRSSAANFEWVFPRGAADAVHAQLAHPQSLADEDVARARIAAGIPAVPSDVGPADLPNEGGLEVDAISFNKGCYLGQEVMARLKSMGQVRRRLLRVGGTGQALPSLPAAVFGGARQIGELRSAVGDGASGWIGLAMLSLLHVKSDARFAFAPDATPTIRMLDSS